MAHIEVEGVSKEFLLANGATTHALRDVTMSVEKGRFVALLGPSGCGKSTLLKMLGGLVRPTTGRCFLDGTEVRSPRRDVSIAFQEPTLLPWRDIRENVSIGLEMAGVGRDERHREAERFLKMVGLHSFARHRPHQLSGGMQQRAALARALSTQPGTLLMDEPFGALDEQTRLMMGEELLRLWDLMHITVLFVTHSIQEAILLADEIVLISRRPGTLKATFEVDLPRPRAVEDLTSPAGQALHSEIWSMLRPEAAASMQLDELEVDDGSVEGAALRRDLLLEEPPA